MSRLRLLAICAALFVSVLAVMPAAAHNEPDDIREALRHFYEDGLSANNPAVADEVFAEGYIGHLAPSFVPNQVNIDSYKFLITTIHGALPDFTATVDYVIVEGDWAASRVTWSGTFSQPLAAPSGEVPPTNGPFVLSFNTFHHFNEEGLIDEEWIEWDNLTWLAMIGVAPVPMPADASATEPVG
jgi:predicted ester cyclase